jgi:hypothetical protein
LWALAFFSVSWSIFLQSAGLLEWVINHRKASTETLDGKWPIILLRGPLGAWGSLTSSKFTTRVKQLKVPPGGLVPWIFPSVKIRRPPPGLNPRRSSQGFNSRQRQNLSPLAQTLLSSCYRGVLPGWQRGRALKLTTRLHLVPRIWMRLHYVVLN